MQQFSSNDIYRYVKFFFEFYLIINYCFSIHYLVTILSEMGSKCFIIVLVFILVFHFNNKKFLFWFLLFSVNIFYYFNVCYFQIMYLWYIFLIFMIYLWFIYVLIYFFILYLNCLILRETKNVELIVLAKIRDHQLRYWRSI